MKRKSLLLLFLMFVSFTLSGCSFFQPFNVMSTTDISHYGKFSTFERHSGWIVLPKVIPNDAIVNGYYYSQKSPQFEKTNYQIYLNITLPEEDYKKEVKRLANIKKETINEWTEYPTSRDIRNDTTHFKYPAYVAMFDETSSFEYALLDEKNHTIIYVMFQFTDKNEIRFNKNYLPKGYRDYADRYEKFKSFNIY